MLVGALLLACTHIATCVRGTVHKRGGVQAQQILLGKNPLCAHKVYVRCMRAHLEFFFRFVFSTNIVCLYIEYTRLVEKIEIQY